MQYICFLTSARLFISSCVGVLVMWLLSLFNPDKTPW
jgi:hypothetical protein